MVEIVLLSCIQAEISIYTSGSAAAISDLTHPTKPFSLLDSAILISMLVTGNIGVVLEIFVAYLSTSRYISTSDYVATIVHLALHV